jgi:hypothetical protein
MVDDDLDTDPDTAAPVVGTGRPGPRTRAEGMMSRGR